MESEVYGYVDRAWENIIWLVAETPLGFYSLHKREYFYAQVK